MALSFKSSEIETLTRRLAKLTGESMTEAVRIAVRERLQRVERHRQSQPRLLKMQQLRRQMRDLPVRDTRTDEEILGLGPDGLPERDS